MKTILENASEKVNIKNEESYEQKQTNKQFQPPDRELLIYKDFPVRTKHSKVHVGYRIERSTC